MGRLCYLNAVGVRSSGCWVQWGLDPVGVRPSECWMLDPVGGFGH